MLALGVKVTTVSAWNWEWHLRCSVHSPGQMRLCCGRSPYHHRLTPQSLSYASQSALKMPLPPFSFRLPPHYLFPHTSLLSLFFQTQTRLVIFYATHRTSSIALTRTRFLSRFSLSRLRFHHSFFLLICFFRWQEAGVSVCRGLNVLFDFGSRKEEIIPRKRSNSCHL